MYEKCECIGSYQEDALKFMREKLRGAIFLPMGTGKTFITIEWMKTMKRYEIDAFPILIFAPKIVCQTWRTEISKFGNGLSSFTPTKGSAPQRAFSARKSDADVIIVNYEIAQHFSNADKHFKTIICDESTRIKNTKAKRSKAVYELAMDCTYRWILTGSPITRDILDIYGQVYVLDQGQRLGESYWKFLNKYCSPVKFGPRQRAWVPRDGSMDTIKATISPIVFKRRREECITLPKKVYEEVVVPQSPEIKRYLKEIADYWRINGKEMFNALAIDMAMRQVCCGFILGEHTLEFDSNKYAAIAELIEDAGSEQVVIWTNFRKEQELIQKAIMKDGPIIPMINGSTHELTRQAILDSFEKKATQVLIVSEAVGAYGLNQLRDANLVIYASNSYDLELRLQSEDRTYRVGRTTHCTYYDVVTEGTVEGHIIELLKSKKQVSKEFIRNRVMDNLRRDYAVD